MKHYHRCLCQCSDERCGDYNPDDEERETQWCPKCRVTKTIFVIAHRRHYFNWLRKNSVPGMTLRLMTDEDDLIGMDPRNTWILPLFRNSGSVPSNQKYEYVYTQASDGFETIELRNH